MSRAESTDNERAVVLAEDPGSLVERVERGKVALLRKTYRSGPRTAWRSLGRWSRARREFENLRALHDAGVPCARVVEWSERRVFGCAVSSTFVGEFVEHAHNLQVLLRDDAGGRAPWRRHRAEQLGKLIRRLHDAGYRSTTLSPRNVMVRDAEPSMLLIDQPHAFRSRLRPLLRAGADLDLFDAFFSRNRLREWSATQRFRGLLAYSAGDRSLARRTWRRLSGRSPWRFRQLRQWCRMLATVLS